MMKTVMNLLVGLYAFIAVIFAGVIGEFCIPEGNAGPIAAIAMTAAILTVLISRSKKENNQ